jgi:hypothetical protein
MFSLLYVDPLPSKEGVMFSHGREVYSTRCFPCYAASGWIDFFFIVKKYLNNVNVFFSIKYFLNNMRIDLI